MNDRDADEDLLREIGRGDPVATRVMVARKLPRLLAMATRLLGDRGEAEDVAQDAFLRIWRQAPRWQAGAASFDTWLHRVTLNLCYDRLRRRREWAMADRPDDDIDPAPAPDETLAEEEQIVEIKRALAALPARQRAAIVLHYYQELSNVDAAAALEVSVEALESLLSRGRRNLRRQLDGSAWNDREASS